MARVFISHSGKDRKQSARMLKWLRDQGFEGAFLDFDKESGIPVGADWERILYQKVRSAEAVVLILTKNWFDSKWCFVEFAQARALGKPIFPVIESPAGDTFVARDIQHLDLLKDREGGLKQLARELVQVALDSREGFFWDSSRAPFPGLPAFDEADAAIYFGRDNEIRELMQKLNAQRIQGGAKLIVLLGASGSGKSSLMRAGVLPRLKRNSNNWIVLPPFRPRQQPCNELAVVLAQALGPRGHWRQIRETFAATDLQQSLRDLERDLRGAYRANDAHILVSIDQGEELFSSADKADVERFWTVLDLLLSEPLSFIVLLALRSDYLGYLQQASRLRAAYDDFQLKPLPREQVREIIAGPAKVAGLSVEDALIAEVMRDAATDDALPLLAFVLRELWERFRKTGGLTLEGYRALGDEKDNLSPLENAVRKRANELMASVKSTPEQLHALKSASIPAMVAINAHGEYVRRPAQLVSLPSPAQPLLERFAAARLLTLREEGGTQIVEVAHEALLRKWTLLRGWLDQEREFLLGKQQLELDLREWERAADAQQPEALLFGLKLTRAQRWLTERPKQLSEAERRFVYASTQYHETQADKRRRQEMVSQSNLLAQVGESERLRGNFDTSLRLCVHAARRHLESQEGLSKASSAAALLAAAVSQETWLLLLRGHQKVVNFAGFSADGERIITASWDKTARVWEMSSGREIQVLRGHEDFVNSAAFNPDSSRIVTASDDKTARIWEVSTGNEIAVLRGHEHHVYSADFSPDGAYIVTASDDKTARIWDTATGKEIRGLRGHDRRVNSAAFSPDGLSIVTVSDDSTARIWETSTGNEIARLLGHGDVVRSGAFSPDGALIVTASSDRTARIWEASSCKEIRLLRGHRQRVNSAAYSPDGLRIVTASDDNTARIWEASTGNEIAVLRGHEQRHDQIDTSAILGRDRAVQIDVFADELGGHFGPRAGRRPARPRPIHAAEARFINEHDAQAPPAPGGGPPSLPHSIRKAVFLKAFCAARSRLG
jgi:hypothetical protein